LRRSTCRRKSERALADRVIGPGFRPIDYSFSSHSRNTFPMAVYRENITGMQQIEYFFVLFLLNPHP
jgi:hypothetical protein